MPGSERTLLCHPGDQRPESSEDGSTYDEEDEYVGDLECEDTGDSASEAPAPVTSKTPRSGNLLSLGKGLDTLSTRDLDGDSSGQHFFERHDNALAVGIGFTRINDIDVVSGKFSAKFVLRLLFHEPHLDDRQHGKLTLDDLKTRPLVDSFTFANCIELKTVELSSINLAHEMDGHEIKHMGLVKLVYWVDGTFLENFELQDFPYDVQNLSVHMRSHIGDREYMLVPWPTMVDFKFDVTISEFHVYKPPLFEMLQEEDIKHRIVFTVVVQRKAWFYELNVMFILFCLTTLAFVTYFITPTRDELGEMIGIDLTLILTTVAFRFVIADKLPSVNYSTVLDKYITTSFFFLMLVIVENVAAVYMPNDIEYFRIAVAAAWALFNICFVLRVCHFLRLMRLSLENDTQASSPLIKIEDADQDDDRVNFNIL